mgnify:CR=1 FL=1
MNITVFTSNQPRHINLIRSLAGICGRVFAVQECNTVFPGQVKDFFNNSPVMQDYFNRVREAERKIFGSVSFLSDNVDHLALKSGDLNMLSREVLEPALASDAYVVFGASYIKGWLVDFLVEKKAINIHMGVSPYYRGSSCNFWAAYDGHPELVGATIHLLDKGLDSGKMLYHALPKAEETEPFDLGMKAVLSAQNSLVERIASGEIFSFPAIPQDRAKEYRYTRNKDFDDAAASEYLGRLMTAEEIYFALKNRDMQMFENPYIS